jgi:hypothetical protein
MEAKDTMIFANSACFFETFGDNGVLESAKPSTTQIEI